MDLGICGSHPPTVCAFSRGNVHYICQMIEGDCVRVLELVSLSFLFHKMDMNDFQAILFGAPRFLGICSDEKVVLGSRA